MDRPRALLLHDGELDRFAAALEAAGVEPQAATSDDVRDDLPMPCDLLVTSGKRTLSMPQLSVSGPGAAPTWICVHTQDFHPLRERLRGLGVHYLVQASIEDRALALFLAQLLHRGAERRREPRLPVGCGVRYRWKARAGEKATLVDLSTRGVRIALDEELPVGAVVELELPAQLAGQPVALRTQVARCDRTARPDGGDRRDALLVWHDLEPDQRLLVDELAAGRRIGLRVAPLAPVPYVDGSGIPDWGALEQSTDRRTEPRHTYREHVDAFADAGPVAALGRNLTSRGVCIETASGGSLGVGDALTVALHSGGRDEPVLAPARVARRNPDGSLALQFDELDAHARDGIDRILATLPVVSSLFGEDGDEPLVVAAEIFGG